MKKITYTLALLLALFTNYSHAQLTDGSIAADFTFTDMNGVSQNLYSYLNQGKYVALDVSATWCGPCWEYHSQIQTMENLYKKHDTPGDKKWKVLFVEGDPKTNDACMTKSAGCTGSTSQGNWLNGTLYPMCNPPAGVPLTNFTANYKINFFPTLYLICPNKKVYGEILNDANLDWPTVLDWENVCKKCGSSVNVDALNINNSLTIYPNPATEHVALSFNLMNSADIKLQVLNSIGQMVDAKDLGILGSGNQSVQYSTGELQKGLYFFIISSGNDSPLAKKVVIE
jgi:thiol-disulfide isomerase/thioredoxin